MNRSITIRADRDAGTWLVESEDALLPCSTFWEALAVVALIERANREAQP